MLGSPEDFESSEDVYDAVGEILLDSTGRADEEGIRRFCDVLHRMLHGGGKEVEDASRGDENVGKLLETPVQLSSKLRIEGMYVGV